MKKYSCILFVLTVFALFPQSLSGRNEQAPQTRWAVVGVSSCFLRLKPDYESSNETQCLMGTVLKVKETDRYWCKVDAPDYKDCWTTELGLAFMTEAQKDEYIAAPKLICISEYAHIYKTPDSGGERICDFTMGDLVRNAPGADVPGWERVLTASGKEAWVLKYDVADFGSWAAEASGRARSEDDIFSLQADLIELASSLLGTPYMWGGNSIKHFDCSGFVKFVYFMNGIVLPRNAREQIGTGTPVPYDFDKMQPGDLIFYGRKAEGGRPMSVTHVAMYIGGGRIIHSSQLVRINSLIKGEPDYYEKETLGVRRIIGNVDRGKGIISICRSPHYFEQ